MLARGYWGRPIGVKDRPSPWWAWGLVAGGLIAAMPTWGQGGVDFAASSGETGATQAQAPSAAVPEVVRPRSEAPTIPRGNDGMVIPAPRSDDPEVSGAGRPIPDSGVIAPPRGGVMPIIPPPGSVGGDRSVVPK